MRQVFSPSNKHDIGSAGVAKVRFTDALLFLSLLSVVFVSGGSDPAYAHIAASS